MRERHPGAAVGVIGPVGERGGRLAGISITDADGLPGRIAGRGGLGAVMGRKRLKAIVVEGAGDEEQRVCRAHGVRPVGAQGQEPLGDPVAPRLPEVVPLPGHASYLFFAEVHRDPAPGHALIVACRRGLDSKRGRQSHAV